MTRLAVCVGIDRYDALPPLTGCERDVVAIERLLRQHHDQSDNFVTVPLLSSTKRMTRAAIREAAALVFDKPDLQIALFYFAGHGAVTDNGSFLVSVDGSAGDEGVPMADIVARANASTARERIIILDCCNAGAVDMAAGLKVPLAKGVSVLASSSAAEASIEGGGRGLFTTRVCDALEGGAADVIGDVTVASIYAYVDEVFSLLQQRPQLMANVSKLVTLRRALGAVSEDKLRKMVEYFPEPNFVFQLDSRYEPKAKPKDERREAIFADLQRFRGARLVEPHGTEHMYFAAMESRSCGLTPLGRFWWARVKARKLGMDA